MQMHKQSTQFDPCQSISTKHYKYTNIKKATKQWHAMNVAGKLLRHPRKARDV